MSDTSRVAPSAWAAEALDACLRRLETGAVTSTELVTVTSSWTGPGDEFSILYIPPWGTAVIGLRRRRFSESLLMYFDAEELRDLEAREFGATVADFDLGDPIDADNDRFWRDSAGVHWWGDI